MFSSAQQLALRIKHLTQDEKKQQQLIVGLKTATPEDFKNLEALLDQHDEEILEFLNQKNNETKTVAKELVEQAAHPIPPVDPDLFSVHQLLNEIFAGPNTFAIFVSEASDKLLAAVEDVFASMVSPEKKEKIHVMFRTLRVHKSFRQKQEKKQVQDFFVNKLKERQEQIKEIDHVLAAVEKEINQQKNKK